MTDQPAALVLIVAMVLWIVVSVARQLVSHSRSRGPDSLEAGAGDTVAFAPAAVQLVAKATTSTRTISGLVFPWDEYGETSVGRVLGSRGCVRLPDDPSRIKLKLEHEGPVIGYATEVHEVPQGIWASFHVPAEDQSLAIEQRHGDRGLKAASDHLADAFSVELSQLQLDGDRITDSYLPAVALLPVPAFVNARVASVTAALSPQPSQEGTTMTEEQRARLRELLSMNARSPEEETEFQQLVQLAAGDQAQPDQQPQQAAAASTTTALAPVVNVHAGMAQAPFAQAPVGMTPAGGSPQQRPLTDLYAAMARVARGESKPGLEAALTSITQGSNAFTTQDQYAGQLWQALTYTRRFINLLSTGELHSYKGNGWKWGVTPAVAAYAGDKAAVPSNAPTTVNVPWTASRLAGAHDLDRKFRDFGDDEFFQAYYEAMTLSYAMLSDQAARDFVIASATAGAAVTGGLLVSIAKVAARLNAAINDGGVDYVLVNDQDKIGLLSVTAASVPAFLEDFVGIQPGSFIGTPAVAAGTIIVGNKNAGQFLELPGSPIRAEVVDMVNGGVDGGVFGYYATVLNMPTAIQKAAWT